MMLYYLDINAIFDVDHYFSWGTPNELRTFEYWQSCFHKWKSHEYSWSRDPWKDDLPNVLNQNT